MLDDVDKDHMFGLLGRILRLQACQCTMLLAMSDRKIDDLIKKSIEYQIKEAVAFSKGDTLD